MLFRMKGLSFFRDYDNIFIDFDLTIGCGEWMTIRGKNGIGKSTLLKLMAGLLNPDSGEISRPEVAFLGHQNGHRSYLTVKGQLKSKQQWLKGTKDLNELMGMCGLSTLQEIKISKLSAGQQRQVALVGVFLSSAPLWLLDEPFEHLDDEALDRYLLLCHRHVQEGGAICQTSHGKHPSYLNIKELH